ncbi:hypothetical protein YYC_03319 [Plasmodium yoelii 17X]|uniref:Secreted protein n=1 Tax=Plasmodium yoelii 17X TaxID=1323249 RepID=V7PJQ0_PLAYE|nr:hypothetical protein YYC_03319 [Plasmodium yoelii 17X]
MINKLWRIKQLLLLLISFNINVKYKKRIVTTIKTSKNVRSIIIFYRLCYNVESRSIFHASIFYEHLLLQFSCIT